MATSGTYSFNLNRNQIIQGALRLVGALETGQPVYPEQINDSAEALNIMCKAMQTELGGLWAIVNLVLFLNTTSQSYFIGPTGSYATFDNIFQSSVSAMGALGDSSIVLASILGLSSGMTIGIQMDDGSTFWTTVNAAPINNIVSLNSALYTTSSIGNIVFAYTNVAQRPLDILEGKRRTFSGNDTPITLGNRDDYMLLSNKSNQGSVTQAYYQPTLNNGLLYVWPVSSNVTDTLVLSAKIPFQDFDNMPDNAYFPVEALRMLKFNLAEDIAPEFGINPNRYQMIKTKALETKLAFNWHDTETSFNFAPDFSGR